MHFSAPTPPPGPDDDLDPWEIDAIRVEVRVFARNNDDLFPPQARDDLLQECLVHWVLQRGKYAGRAGASRETFLKTVVRNKLQDLRKAELGQARTAERAADSLERPVDAEDEAGARLVDLLAATDPTTDPEQEALRRALRDAVRHERAHLSDQEQELLDELLIGESVSEISARLGIPRTSLNYQLQQLKKKLRRTSLADYL